ncbi:phage tail protein [Leuconostoc mesenteroides]|uniref:phage tail protein n=1 Tax=Leuconostoc mesenteroides TaxID=1245 RepID=UPI003D2EC8AE
MITFKNIAGNKFLAVGTIQRKSALNGERSLTGVLYDGEDVLNKIDKGWSLEFDNEPYVVTYFERNDNDNSVSFDAIHKFFWDMNKSVLYSETSGSHTIKWYLDTLFADTRYSYALNFNPNAIQKENWGMKNKLSLFNDIISSIEGEFEINGTLISIFKNIGTDLSTIVRYGFNLSDMTLENDANSFVTYGEGFGEYADPENMTGDRLHVTYTSPLASVYGKLQAEPIDNRNYTISENLLAAVKKQVDDSFSVSVKLSLYDLSVAGYPYKMANVGDWLTAVDENLDFKQRIRIISIDDEFAADGTRISYTVTAGDVGVTKKYQDANASLVSKVEEAVVSSGQAITDANIALIAANGKNKSYYLNSVDDLPQTANEGDLAWVQSGDGRVLYIYTKKSDGSYYWEKRIDPEMGEQIVAGVNDAIAQAKENTDEAISENNTQINETINQVAKEQADLAVKDGDFNNKAQAMADKALSDAKANTDQVAKETVETANINISAAKESLTSDLQKEIADRSNAVSGLDVKAKGYADTAKQDAINAATTADGVINKKIDDTTSSISTTISQNKKDADGKITTAQSTATQALTGLNSKVDTSTYNAKTGQLTTDLTNVTQTANQSKTDIASIKQTDSSQDARMTSIEADANGTKATVSNLQTTQGKQSGDISTLQQRADGFEQTVTKVNNLSTGDRNYILDTGNPKTQTSNGKDNQDFYNSAVFYSPIKNWGVANGDYVISFDWNLKTALSEDMNASVFFNQSPWQEQKFVIKSGQLSGHIDFKFKLSSSILSSPLDVTSLSFRIHHQMVSGNEITYSNLFMKSGTINTTWTPAPEDGSSATAKAQLTADKAQTTIDIYKNDADGRISKAQSDITQTANAVTTKVSQSDYDKKTGELSTSVSNAQQTADSAVTTIGTYKTSNDNRVSTAESKISQNTNDITLRATKSDLDAAKSDYTAQIAQVKVDANTISQTVSQVSSKVDNLSVGGRNLLANSGTASSYSNLVSFANSSINASVNQQVVWPSAGETKVNKTNNGEMFYRFNTPTANNLMGLTSGETYTFGVDIKGDVPVLAFRYQFIGSTGSWYGSFITNLNVTTDYHRESITFVIPKGTTAIYISLQGYANTNYDATEAGIGKNFSFKNSKLEKGNMPTDWTPAPEDVDNKITTQKITIDGITNTVSSQETNINQLTSRVQTAEGNLSTATDNISGLQTKQTQTANQISQEISDRTKGDSNTLQSSKDFTQSSITSAVSGLNSTISQTANGILAQVETQNMITNSEFDPNNVGWYSMTASIGSTIGGAWNTTATPSFLDWPAAGGSKLVNYNVAAWYTSELKTASAGKVFSGSIVAGRAVAPAQSTALDLRIAFWDKNKALLATSSAGNIIDGAAYKGLAKYVVENKTAPTGTLYVSLMIAHSSAANDIIGRPMLNIGTTVAPYTPTTATTSSSTILSLLKDNWSIGIADNVNAITSGIVGNNSSMSLISKNVIIDSPSTQITGTAWIKTAMIADGQISTAKIGDASITSAKISELDVNKLTGNVSNFIQSNWNGLYGSTYITSDGMTVSSGSTTTSFGSQGMRITMASSGGVVIQGANKSNGTQTGVLIGMNVGSTFTSFGFQSSSNYLYNDEMVILKTGSQAAGDYNIGGGVAFNHNVSFMDNIYMKYGKGFYGKWGDPQQAIFFQTINSGIPAIMHISGAGIAFGHKGDLYMLSHGGWQDFNNSSIKGSYTVDQPWITG